MAKGSKYSRRELEEMLDDLKTLQSNYTGQLRSALFPEELIRQAAIHRKLAAEQLAKAEQLESKAEQLSTDIVAISRNVFRIGYTIQRIQAAMRKGLLTREQVSAIERAAKALAARHKG